MDVKNEIEALLSRYVQHHRGCGLRGNPHEGFNDWTRGGELQMGMMTVEREEQIRKHVKDGILFPHMAAELIEEIDRLRLEMARMLEELQNQFLKMVNYRNERDQLRELLSVAEVVRSLSEVGMLTPERLQEAKDSFEKAFLDDYLQAKWHAIYGQELLAEIDRLKSEAHTHECCADVWTERADLQEKLDVAEGAIEAVLNSQALKEAPFYYYSEAIVLAREALTKIRGDNAK